MANNLLIVINAFRPLTFHLYTIGNLLYIFQVQIKTCFESEKKSIDEQRTRFVPKESGWLRESGLGVTF